MLLPTSARPQFHRIVPFQSTPALNSVAGFAVPSDSVEAGSGTTARTGAAAATTKPDESAQKEQFIRGLIRRSPDESVTKHVVEILSAYPLQALQVVHDYGTRIEVYDFEAGEQPPVYVEHLSNPQYLGCYNELANVLGMDRKNATAIPLMHEFAHALDAAMHDASKKPEWQNACTFAKTTNKLVRPYAGTNSCEYMAENTAAYLISDEQLLPVIEDGLSHHLDEAYGLDERGFMQWHQNYCHGRLQTMDPDGFKLVDDLLQRRIYHEKPRDAAPALDEAAYRIAEAEDKARRAKAS